MSVGPNDTIRILDIKTNIPANAGVQVFLKGEHTKIRLFSAGSAYPQRISWNKATQRANHCQVVVQRERMIFGSILLDFKKKGGHHEG